MQSRGELREKPVASKKTFSGSIQLPTPVLRSLLGLPEEEARTKKHPTFGESRTTYCPSCGIDLKHQVVAAAHQYDAFNILPGTRDGRDYPGLFDFLLILECTQCSHRLMRRETGTISHSTGQKQLFWTLNEPGDSGKNEIIQLLTDHPIPLRLYFEFHHCIRTKSHFAAAAVLRMLLEAMCDEQKIPKTGLNRKKRRYNRKLYQRVKDLATTDKHKQILQDIRDLLNASVHSFKECAVDDLHRWLRKVELLIRITYELD